MNKQLFAGKFEIQGEIAKGQTGTIYYGYDLELRQEVAIKIYHSHINGRLIRGKAFIEKSKPLLRLEHPNLIKIFKVEEEDETPVVFMEFFHAPSLQQVIHEEGPLPLGKMLLLAREIAEVLVHTHFQGVIHGSLHPGNVLVGPQGHIKVMDLGLDWILMDILSDCDVELLRPLPYLIPEIAKGELLNVSSDLYCLGFMMYDMLTKRVPYSGLPKTSIMGKLAYDQDDPDFDFPDGVPEAICELIRQMTRNNAQHRLQDATHVLTILNQQLAKLAPDVPNAPAAHLESQPETESSTGTIPSTVPQPSGQAPDSAPNHSRGMNRSQHTIDYQGIPPGNLRKRLGVTLGIILLLLGVTMGYWYKKSIEIPLPSGSQKLPDSTRELIIDPAPPIHSLSSSPTHILNSPLEDPGLRTYELKNEKRPSLSSQENPIVKSSISGGQSVPEIHPVPEQPKDSRPQDSSSITKQPSSQKILFPVTQPSPSPKPSLIISETGQGTQPEITKDVGSHSERPFAPATDISKGIQESKPASPMEESIETVENKELKNLLDSIDATEPPDLPKDPQEPLSQTPSAISSPESSQ
jgi:serine/threonine protein kinase